MPRLRNKVTGAVMTVTADAAKRLGREWVSADASQRSETPDATWKLAELKAYATENEIDLGDATKKDDVLAAIVASTETGDDD